MLLENHNAIESGGYQIANSLRFQASSSSYLSRTPASASNRTTWTWSAWIKRGALGTVQDLFGVAISSGNELLLSFQANDTLQFYQSTSGITALLNTTQVFRDPSAWYHLVAVWDTSNATATDRLKLYINGSRITAFSSTTNPTLNLASYVNNNTSHTMGLDVVPASGNFYPLDGYLSEVNFIDGVSLTPSSFGEVNPTTGQWVAKKYTGVYGVNGFYLPFSNGTSTTTLGNDESGNGNNWTLTNFTRSPGTTDCWMYDVPSGNGSSVGGTQPNSNYATLNPLLENAFWAAPSRGTFQRGNLRISQQNVSGFSTFDVNTDSKWYFEMTSTSNQSISAIMVAAKSRSTFEVAYMANGQKIVNGSGSGYGASWTAGDTIGVAIDRVNNQITFYKNNVSQGTITNTFPASGISLYGGYYAENTGVDTVDFNFGQRTFLYTPPSGFKALCTANLPAATIKKGNTVFDATLYTGNATARSITNAAGFAPDMVWVKARSSATDNYIWDTVRGNFGIVTNSTAAEFAGSQVVPNSTGFALENSSGVNANGTTYVGWQWDAGSSTVTNTSGTISSQVRANPTAGVSVVTWTPTASAGTVGHGLGVAPKMIVMKDIQNSYQWFVYHASIGAGKYLGLNTTTATTTNASVFSTTPTSSVFDPGTGLTTGNLYGNQVAYCFSEIAGFSKFGSYTGNGSTDGPFIFTGFRPKFVMIKNSSAASTSWNIQDTSRNPSNLSNQALFANVADAEFTSPATSEPIDILSNGFKLRGSGSSGNGNGNTIIYMAFAENPFANANAR